MCLDEEMMNLEQNLDEQVVERVDSLKEKREGDILDARNRIANDQHEIEARREQELDAGCMGESVTCSQLCEYVDEEAVDDLAMGWTKGDIVKQDDTVTSRDLETLERMTE